MTCFLSHSWRDEDEAPGAKYECFKRWARRHEETYGEESLRATGGFCTYILHIGRLEDPGPLVGPRKVCTHPVVTVEIHPYLLFRSYDAATFHVMCACVHCVCVLYNKLPPPRRTALAGSRHVVSGAGGTQGAWQWPHLSWAARGETAS